MYTRCFSQSADGPLVKARGGIYRCDNRILYEWLTDDVDCEPMAVLDIVCRVFDPGRSVGARKGHQGWPIDHLDTRC